MSFGKVLLETPAGKRFVKKVAAESDRKSVRRSILNVLQTRFGTVPKDLPKQLAKIQDQHKLNALVKVAAVCPDVDAFRAEME